MEQGRHIIVIGAGASGAMAAITAARHGARVTLIDGNPALGRKINATGNGRCNFTNADGGNISHYYGATPEFIGDVLRQFSVEGILKFFGEIGVEPMQEEDGKYFPLSGQACAVSELLERYMGRLGVTLLYGKRVTGIKTDKHGVTVLAGDDKLHCDGVIIATGGMASPDSGSNGVGYELAKSLGHSIVPIAPVIVQIKTKGGFYKSLSGLRVKAGVSLECDGRTVRTEQGDLMFFDYGLSGPPIFSLSTNCAYLMNAGKRVYMRLDLLLGKSDEWLRARLADRRGNMDCAAEDMLCGLLHKKLVKYVLAAAGVAQDRHVSGLSDAELLQIVQAVKGSRVEAIGTKGWENAQATAGGVTTSEIDSHTLISKLNSRVGFCGEVLDVVGDCGGYNLTWAWASGYACGRAMAEALSL